MPHFSGNLFKGGRQHGAVGIQAALCAQPMALNPGRIQFRGGVKSPQPGPSLCERARVSGEEISVRPIESQFVRHPEI